MHVITCFSNFTTELSSFSLCVCVCVCGGGGGGGVDMSSNFIEPPHYEFPSYGPSCIEIPMSITMHSVSKLKLHKHTPPTGPTLMWDREGKESN